MSLNKFTNLETENPWMKLNCDQIVCNQLTVKTAGTSVLNLTGIETVSNVNPLGLKTIMKANSGIATLNSLGTGYDGQVIHLSAGYNGGDIFVKHNVSSGAPGEKVIYCSGSADTLVLTDTYDIGFATLTYSETLGVWLCATAKAADA